MKYLRLSGLMLLSWWPMMAVHELGHVVGCLFSGAKIERIILWPWLISQTVRTGSSLPWLDTWTGPVLGAVLPYAAYLVVKARASRARVVVGFFAGFCLIANGLYLGVGWADAAGDAGDLLRIGQPLWALILFGVTSSALGLLTWHREPLTTS